MTITVLECPHCGAGLPLEAVASGVYVCTYCKRALLIHAESWRPRPAVEAVDPPAFPDRPRVKVGDATYIVHGRLAQGEGCDVFLGQRDARITEMVVLKVLRALKDRDLLAREWKSLAALQSSSAQGAEHFTTLLPQPVQHAPVLGESERMVSVFRWRSGFQHTFEDIRKAFPEGVEGQTAVWLWKRTLELLGFIHRSGYVHGAILPAHLLVHPRDHGVVLCGFSRATRYFAASPEKLPATSAGAESFYPSEVWRGEAPSPSTDLTMVARCVTWVLSGDALRVPESVPAPIRNLLEAYGACEGRRPTEEAWDLMGIVGIAGKQAYGPPRYHPFKMPGWR